MERQAKRGPKPKDTPSTPLAGIPDPPPYLDKVAKAFWRDVLRQLDDAGTLSTLDRHTLAAYCTVYSHWRTAEDKVREEGQVIIARNGYAQTNPWYDVAVQCQKSMITYANMFGLSPSSRSRIKVSEKPPVEDPKWQEPEGLD